MEKDRSIWDMVGRAMNSLDTTQHKQNLAMKMSLYKWITAMCFKHEKTPGEILNKFKDVIDKVNNYDLKKSDL
mgnify:CR=1 FL=1